MHERPAAWGASLITAFIVLGFSTVLHAQEKPEGDAKMDKQLENAGLSEPTDRDTTSRAVKKKSAEEKVAPDAPFDVAADVDAKRNRYVPSVFPFFGGNSDIGVQLGLAGNITRFHDDAQPYDWALNGVLTTSLKGGDEGGLRLVQHDYLIRFVSPSMMKNRLRLDLLTEFVRTIDAGYWGIGNATEAIPPPGQKVFGRTYEYLRTEARERAIARVHTDTPVDIAFGALIRYESPEVYGGSKLEADLTPTPGAINAGVRGGVPMLLAGLSAGVMYDTRDTEFVTRRGGFYQVGAGATVGSEQQVRYGSASAIISNYLSLSRAFTLANRLVAAIQFGEVPFYDLQQGGNFEPQFLLGGANGVRGVPLGRYAGPIKFVANTELRTTPLRPFTVLSRPFLVGVTTFVDIGRTFADYTEPESLDGKNLGLKYGVGGGIFALWGSSALFRVELAYSPDAVSENPNLPIGIYVADGLMF